MVKYLFIWEKNSNFAVELQTTTKNYTIMTQVEMFHTLNAILTMSMNSHNGVHDYVLNTLRDMPRNLKIYVVSSEDYTEKQFTNYKECLAEWKSNKKWTRMYYFNPCGDITHLKDR